MTVLIRPGGLYRCCETTIHESSLAAEPAEGQMIRCPYCQGSMVFHRGAWEWFDPDYPPLKDSP